jgi:hypothetical protein
MWRVNPEPRQFLGSAGLFVRDPRVPRRPELPGEPPESEVQAQDSACESAKPRLSVLYKNLSAPPRVSA